MLKQIIMISSFFSVINGLELRMMGPYDRYDGEVGLSDPEDELARSSQAHDMSWLPQLYKASELTDRMSPNCFMVNALDKIKECMANTRCFPGLQDCAQDVECLPARDWESLFIGAELTASFTAIVWGILHAASGGNRPHKFPEGLIMGSCFKAREIFNYTLGMEWADWCITQSIKIDKPCNVTAARESFNKNGGGYFYDASACCYDTADPVCYQQGLAYNRDVYPALHEQAKWDAMKPLLVIIPIVLGIQLAYVGGIKLKRCLRDLRNEARVRMQAPTEIAAPPFAEVVEDESL